MTKSYKCWCGKRHYITSEISGKHQRKGIERQAFKALKRKKRS